MNEKQLRHTISKLLSEGYSEGDQYVCFGGKTVPFGSDECLEDMYARKKDATRIRDNCSTRTDKRDYYNGMLKVLRREIRKAEKINTKIHDAQINEQIILEYIDSSEMYQTFIQPFVDVAKAVKISSQEVLAAGNLLFKQLITFNTKKKKEHLQDYRNTTKELNAKWGEVFESLQTPDAEVFSFLAAPSMYLGSKAIKAGVKAPGAIADYLDEAGLGTKFLRKLFGIDDSERADGGRGAAGTAGAAAAGKLSLLDRLKVLFTGEPVNENKRTLGKPIILEENKSQSIQEEIAQYLEGTGILDELDVAAKEMLEAKKEQIENIKKDYQTQLDILSDLATVSDLTTVVTIAEKAREEDLQIGQAINKLADIEKSFAEEVERLKGDEKFIRGIDPEGTFNDMQIDAAAKKAAKATEEKLVGELMPDIKSQAQEMLPDVVTEIKEQLAINIPPEKSEAYKLLEKSDIGRRLLKEVAAATKWLADFSSTQNTA